LPLVSAGFFSKDMILGALWGNENPMLWAAALTGALLTAIYSFRLIFTVFFGPVITMPSGRYGLRILLPLGVLGVAALSIGWLETPDFLGGRHLLAGFLHLGGDAARLPVFIPLAGCAVPLIGVFIAWYLHRTGYWRAQGAEAPLVRLLRSGCGFDAVYRATLVKPFLWLVNALRHDPVDQLFAGLEHAAIAAHRRLRATQTGELGRYATWIMAGAIATIAAVVFA
jgi:NADH-quinone oxidoreductase subunit L